jgi:hypothetical protein
MISPPSSRAWLTKRKSDTAGVHGTVDGSDASLKAQEDARRSLYRSAMRECDVLKSSIASECRLETLNVNINRSYGSPQNEGFNANGNFTFRVMLK